MKKILCLLMTLCLLLGAGIFAVSAAEEVDTPALGDDANGHDPLDLTSNNPTVGIRFNAAVPFWEIGIIGATYSDVDGANHGCTAVLYAWNQNYATTIAGTPVKSAEVKTEKDGGTMKLSLGEHAPAGEYIVLLKDGFGVTGKGTAVWIKKASVPNVQLYNNGEKISGSIGGYVAYTYDGAKANPFFLALSADTDPKKEETSTEVAGKLVMGQAKDAAMFSAGAESVGAVPFPGDGTMAVRFHATTDFNKIIGECPTWDDPTSGATFKLYKWNKDYNTTIKGTPVATKKFENVDQTKHSEFTFDNQPEGEYLLVISDVVKTLGVWANYDSFPNVEYYENGVKFTNKTLKDGKDAAVSLRFRINYVNTPEILFGKLSSTGNVQTGDLGIFQLAAMAMTVLATTLKKRK